jgi:hypothetical protein
VIVLPEAFEQRLTALDDDAAGELVCRLSSAVIRLLRRGILTAAEVDEFVLQALAAIPASRR